VEERTRKLNDSERLAAIGTTAGMVGHDLRNPLQSIRGETYLAKSELQAIPESESKKNIQESIETIEKQIIYMNKIVSDLQDFVKPINPTKKPFELHKFIKDMLGEIIVPENIKVQAQITEDVPMLNADWDLLKRVFINLLNNAIQAMPEGGILQVNAVQKDEKVQISVKDTGSGIPESVKPKIFVPLFTTKSKGQGFGLAVCKRVVEAHGGTITFESQEGKGATFTVELTIESQ
jgi:signal transduction histidine kinase